MTMWYVAPLEMNEGNSLGQGYNRPTGCSAERPHTRLFYRAISLLGSWWGGVNFPGRDFLSVSKKVSLGRMGWKTHLKA